MKRDNNPQAVPVKTRPLRLYKNKLNRKRYVRRNRKKLYVKAGKHLTNSNIVKVVVQNQIKGLTKLLPRRRAPNKTKTAFTEQLDKKHPSVPNTPYYQLPTVTKVDKTRDDKHAGEMVRIQRKYEELKSKHKEEVPIVKVEKVEKVDEPPPPIQPPPIQPPPPPPPPPQEEEEGNEDGQ